jgi:WD40 repeat protein
VLEGHTNTVWSLAFHPIDSLLFSADVDGIIRIWDIPTQKAIGVLSEDEPPFRALAFSADGSLLAAGTGLAGSADGAFVHIWEYPSGRRVATLQGHSDAVWSVGFGPDVNQVTSGSLDGTVRIWDFSIQKEIIRFEGRSPVRSLAVNVLGRTLLANSLHTVRRIDLKPGDWYAGLRGDSEAMNAFRSAAFTLSDYVLDGAELIPRAWQLLLMRSAETSVSQVPVETRSIEQEINKRSSSP